MPLTPGARIGPYEIVAPIGAGGMGEVYRAMDTKLGRDVAIKILPAAFVADPDRVARFEREARTLATLNHTNIAQIHGLEDLTVGSALVMEFVDGEDLSTVIARGRVPVHEALTIARQVAAALEAAHEAGIIHRDLKPANIKLRADGTVKVLDFGLAKAMGAPGSDDAGLRSSNAANSPTLTAHATELGLILGTAAYMSPEQARGKPVDRRADVWAFGVVLYEMLLGKRAFEGGEVSDVLASVLKDTLPLDSIPADTPASIRRLLRRCLHKDRNERLDSMTTARLEIADALAADGREDSVAVPATPAPALAKRSWWPLAATAVVVAALTWLAGSMWRSSGSGPENRVVSFNVSVPGDLTGVTITPSGDTVILQSDRLYLRGLADATMRPIPGTEGARNLSISPDGRWIAFFTGGKLRKVAIAGGDPLALADVDYDSPGAGWGPNNTLLFTPGWNAALYSVSADPGGKPTAVSTVDVANGELSHWWPQTLPGQKSVLFTIWMAAAGINDARIGVLDLTTGKHRIVGPGAFARYTASGHLIYFHAGGYHAVKFDLAAMRPSGDAVAVLADVLPHDPLGNRHKPFAISDDGTLVAVAGPLLSRVQWAWTTPNGSTTPINLPTEAAQIADLSADGLWLVTSRIEGGLYTLWMHDLSRPTQEKIELPGSSMSPSWSPDGRFFIFTSMTKGHFDPWQYRRDDGRATAVIADPLDQNPVTVSNDGKMFILEDTDRDGTIRVTHGRFDAPGKRTVIEGLIPAEEIRFSPDDRWIAAEIRIAGRSQIVVRPFPSGGPPITISPQGGEYPLWPPKGSRIFYQRGDEIVAVPYSMSAGRFSAGAETVVFRQSQRFRLVGVAPDGRFLIGTFVPGQTREARVVVNWTKELPK